MKGFRKKKKKRTAEGSRDLEMGLFPVIASCTVAQLYLPFER